MGKYFSFFLKTEFSPSEYVNFLQYQPIFFKKFLANTELINTEQVINK